MTTRGDIINESQRRAVRVTLALLDETLCRFEEWARGREARSVLYEEQNLLTNKQRSLLLAEVARMRPVIDRLKDVLRLPRQVCSAADDIWSRSASMRENLMGLERLTGYGDVHPDLQSLLAERVPLLSEGLTRMTAAVAGTHGLPPS